MTNNLHPWAAYRCAPAKTPMLPHIAVILFCKGSVETPGYDRGDPPERFDYTEALYYAFTDRGEAAPLVAAASAIKDVTVVCLDVAAGLTATVKTVATLS